MQMACREEFLTSAGSLTNMAAIMRALGGVTPRGENSSVDRVYYGDNCHSFQDIVRLSLIMPSVFENM